MLVALLLSLQGTALSCEGQPCDRDFHLEAAQEVRLPHGGYLREASGLTQFAGTLWTVADKSDAAIYRLKLPGRDTVVTAQEVPLAIPPPNRKAVRRCGDRRRGRLDLEGIAAGPGDFLSLLSESYRAVLITRVDDPRGPAPRATVQEILCIPGHNQSRNDGVEGLSGFPGGTLALEEGKGWPTKRLYRCRFPKRRCTPLLSLVLSGRTPDLTSLDPQGTRFLVLNTFWGWWTRFHKICEIHGDDPTPKACLLDLAQVKATARERADLPASFRQEGGTNYEGIHFDPVTGRLYLINDNNAFWNRRFTGDAEREPTLLLIFRLKRD
ncbi:MAG: esterase-like activity of phytase family protein [Candidatus Methylomirabilales bacterium]